MSTETQITPALTPEEWAEFRQHPEHFLTYPRAKPEDFTAQVAINNAALPDDDPRKITRADVDDLRRAAARLDYDQIHGEDAAHMERVARLADRIAALLPDA